MFNVQRQAHAVLAFMFNDEAGAMLIESVLLGSLVSAVAWLVWLVLTSRA